MILYLNNKFDVLETCSSNSLTVSDILPAATGQP